MSIYTNTSASAAGLVSGLHLSWDVSNTVTMISQSIYYTDVYQSGDGSLMNDNKFLDIGATDTSATIMGLDSDRVYNFTIVGTTDSAEHDEHEGHMTGTPLQPAVLPVFTVANGDGKVTITVTNHTNSTDGYTVFIDGAGLTDKIRSFSGSSTVINGLTNSTGAGRSYYEISLRGKNSVSTSAMTASQTAEATDALASVTGLEVLTGVARASNETHMVVVNFNAVAGAASYRVKAFVNTESLDNMILDATNNLSTWFSTTELNLHMNNSVGTTALAAGTEYQFAVIPVTEANGNGASVNSLVFVKATPSAIPDTNDIVLSMKTGIDISNGSDTMAFAEMDGKLRLNWSMTQNQYDLLGNGLPLTGMTFDLSGTDNEVTKQLTVAGDLSSGSIIFSGLTNGKTYKAGVKTSNANGDSAVAFSTTASSVVSTRPTEFTFTAGPALDAQDANGDGSVDVSWNMNGNGLDVSFTGDFIFDVSGVGNSYIIVSQTVTQLNALNVASWLSLGNTYQITATAFNANGNAVNPLQISKVVKPSKRPEVVSGDWNDTKIKILTTTDINKIIVNLNDMVVTEYGYATTGAKIRAVYDNSTNAITDMSWSSDWKTVDDLSADIELALPAITSNQGPHTDYRLEIQPFNAVYGPNYGTTADGIITTVANTNPSGYPSNASSSTAPGVFTSGLETHTTEIIQVTSKRLGIYDLQMVSEVHAMESHIIFEWKCDAAGSSNLELWAAKAALASPAYAGYADAGSYTQIATMSSTLFVDASGVVGDAGYAAASGLMTYDLSNSSLTVEPKYKYYFQVREAGHYDNMKTASGVSKALPVISDLSFSDFKSRDIISFTVDPMGAKLDNLFLLNNLDSTSSDFFFNMLDAGAVASSVADKLANQIGGPIKVQLEKTQFNLDGALPANPLFTVLGGNSVGLSLGAAVGGYTDLMPNENPTVVAEAQKVWADKADALYAEALLLAAEINADPVKYAAGIKNNAVPPVSPADTAAAAVQTAAALATVALNEANQAAVDGVVVSYTNQDAEHHHNLTDDALDALKTLKVAVPV